MGFAVQSMLNNDRALPAWQLLHPISSVCEGQTEPVAQPREEAQPLQGSLATLQAWSWGPFAPQLRKGCGQMATESPLTQGDTERVSKSHCQQNKAALGHMSHSHVWTLRLAQEIPGEGLLSQFCPCHLSLGMHTTCHQPLCSPSSGRVFCNSRQWRPGPGLVHPIVLSPHASSMTLIHPQPSLGVRVQPQCWSGDFWHLHHAGHILKPTHPSLGVTHLGVSQGGVGTAVERRWGCGWRWWERTGAPPLQVTQWQGTGGSCG